MKARRKQQAKKRAIDKTLLETGQWEKFFRVYFPVTTHAPFAERHRRLLNWFEALTPGIQNRPRVEVWPRGGAKSSTGGLGVVRLAVRSMEVDGEVRPPRRFVLYVSGTQGQANKHVASIQSKLENLGISRAVGKYGNSKGWKIDLIRTDTGFNVLALGLDAAARGIKLDDFRPDLIIFDDIDERHDTEETIQKKISTITDSILPAGSVDCAILFLQNKIHKDSIVARLCDGRADFLLDREPPAIEPAVEGLKYERVAQEDGTYRYKITGGIATWEGQNLKTCEKQFNEWGRSTFLRESQHETDEVEDGLWQRERDIEPFRYKRSEMPTLTRIAVAIDPSWSSTGDEAGIVAVGIGTLRGVVHGYVLRDETLRGSPGQWAQRAVDLYDELEADVLLGEGNFMGDVVKSTIRQIPGAPAVKIIHVSRGKLIRAEPVQAESEAGRLHFPITGFPEMESQCCRYKPGMESPGRMDALVIAVSDLMLKTYGTPLRPSSRNARY